MSFACRLAFLLSFLSLSACSCRAKPSGESREPVEPRDTASGEASGDATETPGEKPKSSTRTLTITTFNLLNYGRDEDKARLAERDEHLVRYFKEELRDTDVFVLQEIVDKERFKSRILPYHPCLSYDSWEGHQFVMVCVKAGLNLVKHDSDDNYAIEELSMGGKLRPAVHGVVQDESGKPLLYVMGVHLKASPDSAAIRKEQAEMLAEAVARGNDLPVVLAGDFNTTEAEIDAFEALFAQRGVDLQHLAQPRATYNDGGTYKRSFDHFWASRDLEIVSGPVAAPICEGGKSTNGYDIHEYNRYISDHCPVTMTVRLAQ